MMSDRIIDGGWENVMMRSEDYVSRVFREPYVDLVRITREKARGPHGEKRTRICSECGSFTIDGWDWFENGRPIGRELYEAIHLRRDYVEKMVEKERRENGALTVSHKARIWTEGGFYAARIYLEDGSSFVTSKHFADTISAGELLDARYRALIEDNALADGAKNIFIKRERKGSGFISDKKLEQLAGFLLYLANDNELCRTSMTHVELSETRTGAMMTASCEKDGKAVKTYRQEFTHWDGRLRPLDRWGSFNRREEIAGFASSLFAYLRSEGIKASSVRLVECNGQFVDMVVREGPTLHKYNAPDKALAAMEGLCALETVGIGKLLEPSKELTNLARLFNERLLDRGAPKEPEKLLSHGVPPKAEEPAHNPTGMAEPNKPFMGYRRDIREHIGEHARRLREHFGIPVAMAAECMGDFSEVSQMDVKRIEDGKIVELEDVKRLCSLYGVSEKSLCYGGGLDDARLSQEAAQRLAFHSLKDQTATVAYSAGGKDYVDSMAKDSVSVLLTAEDGEISVFAASPDREPVPVGTLGPDSFDQRFVDRQEFYDGLALCGTACEQGFVEAGRLVVKFDARPYIGCQFPSAQQAASMLGIPVQGVDKQGDLPDLGDALLSLTSEMPAETQGI